MLCPYCGGSQSRVIDSRPAGEGNRRRRECEGCGRRFSTFEAALAPEVRVLKADGRTEAFEPGKLRRVIRRVARDRPLSAPVAARLVGAIEGELLDAEISTVKSLDLAGRLYSFLSEIDTVAAERFAADYRDEDRELRFVAPGSSGDGADQLDLFPGSVRLDRPDA